MTAMFDWAMWWRRRGYNIVPQAFGYGKFPAVRWKELQSRGVTEIELLGWRAKFDNGVGFITGAISGVIVVETDGDEGEALIVEFERLHGALSPTLTIRSGSGRGLHRHFLHPGDRVPTRPNAAIKVDVKGDGGFCLLPPSLHKSGGRYEVLHFAEPAPLPNGLLDFIDAKSAQAKGETPRREQCSRIRTNRRNLAREAAKAGYGSLPVTRTNIEIIMLALAALPDEYAREYDLWLRVGFALHSFDEGRVGLALFKHFSARCTAKAERCDFDRVWQSFNRNYQGDGITLGFLVGAAQRHGWQMPTRWERAPGASPERRAS